VLIDSIQIAEERKCSFHPSAVLLPLSVFSSVLALLAFPLLLLNHHRQLPACPS